jgi:hypothetical protein
MHVTIEYILAGMLMVLVLVGTETTMSALMSQRITAFQEGNQLTVADNILNAMLLTPGDPANWGDSFAQPPISFGLADQGTATPYRLSTTKIMRLQNGSLGYISPTELRSMMGLRDDVQFSLTITPIMTVNINGNGPFAITVRDSRGNLSPNVNITAYYIPAGSSGGQYPTVSNITGFDGKCTIAFNNEPGYVLVTKAEQSGVVVIATSPAGWNYWPEGGIVILRDTSVFAGLTYTTGTTYGINKKSAQRYAEIGGQTYLVALDIWGV